MKLGKSALARFPSPSESEAKVLGCILRGSRVDQPELARATGLSQQSVSRLVNELVDRGALSRGERSANGRRGQPSTTVRIAPDYAYSVGVALMTDAMSVLLMDFSGVVIAYSYQPMASMRRALVFGKLEAIVNGFIRQHAIDRQRLFGVGVGISGYCLDGKSRYNPPSALDDWALIEIDKVVSDALGLPTWVENDGNTAAIGESFLGAGRTYSNFVYLFIAAGIGGGLIQDHKLWRGTHGNGAEVGLIVPRAIYQLPTLETLLHSLKQHGVRVDTISAMLAGFDPNWRGIDEWIEQSRHALSLIVSAIAATVDPEAIVLGGRIPASLAERIIPAIEIYDDARRAEPRPLPRLMLSQTEHDACAIGAAMLPLERHFYSALL